KVVVLGGGMVGGVIARDLSKDADIKVVVADKDPKVLAQISGPIEPIEADLSDMERVKGIVRDYDLVVGAVPGFLGQRVLKAVIEAGKDYSDISFMPEDPRELDGLAKEKDVTAVVDCGVAPGMSNMIVGRLHEELDRTDEVLIFVGGLPTIRTWPYEYKAPFSPIDVIEEYTRPARYMRDGRRVTMPALSEPEMVELPGVGTLEAFNTDGLRSLLFTIDCPDMKEKTLRYPGHVDKMLVLRETGLFGTEMVEAGGVKVRPVDLTCALLFPMWKSDNEEEFTIMRVQVTGRKDGRRVRHTYDLLDRTDRNTGISSMARTTGFPVAIMARLMLNGEYKERGVMVPEFIGKDVNIFRTVLDELKVRGVVFHHSEEEL
ncbi:MAG: saccharopine dehydrogenase NADP-binding domain-containing protein, partial [Thermoplasmata archaeon]|nr:saccharopine dehydrogenase NADP-binding domain-containing protein [Thermoplasmata archaeon]